MRLVATHRRDSYFLFVVASLVAVCSISARAEAQETQTAAPSCTAGQLVTADTAGHCCWPNQAWSTSGQRCVGIPICPSGLTPQGETCAVACPPGQSVGPDTAGQCCWPNQAWSGSMSRCIGIPACPAGLVAQGEACVAQAQFATVTTPGPGTGVAQQEESEIEYGAFGIPRRRRTRTQGEYVSRPRIGLGIAGTSIFVVGYLMSAMAAGFTQSYYASNSWDTCFRTGELGFIPLFGAAIAMAGMPSHDSRGNSCTDGWQYPALAGLVTLVTVLQVAGFGMGVLGFATRTQKLVHRRAGIETRRPIEWSVLPGARGADLGLTLSITHF